MKKQSLDTAKWAYSFDVMTRINAELVMKVKDYIGEEEMLKSELEKFNELSNLAHNRIKEGILKPDALPTLLTNLNKQKELSNFYFACYQKLRNRLKFEALFFDEADILDIEKCEAYLLFEKRLEHNVGFVEHLLGRRDSYDFIQLEDFEIFCSNFRSLLSDAFILAIDEQIVELRINIYETMERIAKLEKEEAFRTNFIEDLKNRVTELKLTAEFYENKVIQQQALGGFFVRSKTYLF